MNSIRLTYDRRFSYVNSMNVKVEHSWTYYTRSNQFQAKTKAKASALAAAQSLPGPAVSASHID